ncbi:hypothetical protein ES705_02203 [subsurface metagenome]
MEFSSFSNRTNIKPKKIWLDASTVCQLKCRSCPTATGEIGKKLGKGFLQFKDFKEIVDKNPQIHSIELSNWGEIFLNKELPEIIKYAYMHNVALNAVNGVNLNNADENVLEALVKYKFRQITCAIDGASQKTYSVYRVNGNFDQVIENIKTINRFKNKYNSFFPVLKWQFIIFGHNENEIGEARKMARNLNMIFNLKLNWNDLYVESFSPIKNAELVRKESGLGVATREEFRQKYGRDYCNQCLRMWTEPQINYDGRLLGCDVNYWGGDYGNILEDGLYECINSEKMNYAREMLMGKVEERDDIPCIHCKNFGWKKEYKTWVTNKDIKYVIMESRKLVMIENKLFEYKLINKIAEKMLTARQWLKQKKIY